MSRNQKNSSVFFFFFFLVFFFLAYKIGQLVNKLFLSFSSFTCVYKEVIVFS